MATTTYFTDVMMISVHTISDSTPSTTSGVGVPLVMLSTVLSVYSGLGADIAKDNPKRGQAQCGEPGPADRYRGIGVRRDASLLAHQSKGVGARGMLQAQRDRRTVL